MATQAVANIGEDAGASQTEDVGAQELSSLSSQDVVQKYGRSPADTGSPEVQVALITRRLQILGKHFQKNAQDKHSKRGMMRLISARKGLLQYLRESDIGRYRALIGSLGLRK
jgi:small subunit ribosomal protein S15